jgi:hypothetical protein
VPRKEEATLKGQPLASASLAALSWQQVLRTSSMAVGISLECRRSIRDQIGQQAEAYNATKLHERVFTLRMEATERDYDGTMTNLFTFLTGAHARWPGRAAAPPPPAAPHAADLFFGTRVPGTAPDGVGALVAAAARFDLSRHRKQLDDGHLSATQRKRQLRGLLLNDTKLAAELARWRAATGYDRSYREHCKRYGSAFYDEAVADGFAQGAAFGRRRKRRRRRRMR